jgi:hypothetical protein
MRYRHYPTLAPQNPARLPFFVARNPFAWPGGYPVALVLSDGACLCPGCCRSEAALVSRAGRDPSYRTGWEPEAATILDGDEVETCAHCGEPINPQS